MRHFALALALALVSAPLAAQTLSQTTDSTTISLGNSLACATTVNGIQLTVQNSYWRAYDLSTFSQVVTPVTLTSVSFGVEIAANSTAATTIPMELRIYLDASPSPFPSLATATLVQTVAFNMPTGTNFIHREQLTSPLLLQTTDTVIVELFQPDGVATGNTFFVGSNRNGESAPGFLSAPGCGITVPTLFTGLGVTPPPVIHIILDLNVSDGNPRVELSQPGGPLTPVVITNDRMIPGRDYINIFTTLICPTGPGTGPYLGLCGTSLDDFVFFFTLPTNFPPIRFTATSDRTVWPGIAGLPPSFQVEILTIDFTAGQLLGWSPVFFYQVQ